VDWTSRIRTARWVRWALIVAAIVATYAALGFWGVPFLVERQLPRWAASELGRQASAGHVRFNPFTLRFEAGPLRLAEASGQPLFSAGQFAVQLKWGSIVRRAWSFADVRLTEPQAFLSIAADGRFNVAELLETVARRWPPDPEDRGGPPRLSIDRVAVERGKVQFQDHRAGYANVLTPLDFTLAHFSTLPGETDSHSFVAMSPRGGAVRWKGTATLDPIRGSGELALENVPLPEPAVYLKAYTHARLAAGQVSMSLPYRFSYEAGRWDASLAGASMALRDVALAREGATDAFATLAQLDVKDIDAGWAARQVLVGELRASGGKLAVLRDAKGQLDLGSLLIAAAAPKALPPAGVDGADEWKFTVKNVALDQVALSARDDTVQPPLRLAAGNLRLQGRLASQLGGPNPQVRIEQASAAAQDLVLSHGDAMPLKLTELGFEGANMDLAAHVVDIARVHARGGALQVTRDRAGRLNVVDLLPGPGAPVEAAAPGAPDAPWKATVARVELGGFSAEVHDEASGVKLRVADAGATLEGAGTDLTRSLAFQAGLQMGDGGRLAAQGQLVPDTGALQADVRVAQFSLAPFEPLLRQSVKLKIAQGSVSGQGRLIAGQAGARDAKLRYLGSLNVAGLTLKEDDGDVFAAWRSVSAERLTASLGPDLLDIPDLRVSGLNAKLIIEDDRSFNAARLLVAPAAPASQPAAAGAVPLKTAAPAAPPASGASFPVRVRRVRLQDAKLEFADLSLRPQFAARIHELNGVVSGLSTDPASRTQVELDGRVDEFGTVRARGDLNAFAPTANTDLNVVFKNVDMVPASPYSTKFAGYKVAEGKISLDLQYKLRDRQLQGENQIVIDRLTLGERVDSPDALKLPLQLAIAILKDKDGRIELGLPVSGDLSDPQFSYGAIIWKAIGALITKIVTAPFRALGAMLGVGGDKLESVHFDPGSARLLPPEREKLQQVAQLLAKRPQLNLSVPPQSAEAADSAALRTRAVRLEVARRAGIPVSADDAPPPVDFGDGDVRKAVRELYVARFGDAELDRQKRAAESAPPPSAAASAAGSASAKQLVPLWKRFGQVLQGEPQVPDAAAFYDALLARLNETQPLPADAMTVLGSRRAEAVLAALKDAGVEPARVSTGAPEKLEVEARGPVPLKLALGAR
jgi:uncharacterized protein involved in outer membrane biogenesis